MTVPQLKFVVPPGWPVPPADWAPPEDWVPDPNWPPAPPDWQFWQLVDQAPDVSRVRQTVQPSETPTASDSKPNEIEQSGERSPCSARLSEERRSAPPVTATDAAGSQAPSISQGSVSDPHDSSNDDLTTLRAELDRLRAELQKVRENDALADVGIYQYRHPLENAAAYKSALEELQERVRAIVRRDDAIQVSDKFVYNNSVAQGRRLTADFGKLMLRAFNAEADNCVRALRAGSVASAVKRLKSAADQIARLGKMMEMRVSDEYQALRVREIELTGDYLMRLQEEREAAREERERLKDERRAEMELAAERERLQKERAHYTNAVETLLANGKQHEAAELADRLESIDKAIAENDFRLANIRAGYVYVISNIGAFGDSVVKIGLTRRLDPLDRVRELGDASVPFPFDVHALIFSKDAVSLEGALHKHFADRRVNLVNLRREFFRATPSEVRRVLEAQLDGQLLEFGEEAEALQFRQSRSMTTGAGDSTGHRSS